MTCAPSRSRAYVDNNSQQFPNRQLQQRIHRQHIRAFQSLRLGLLWNPVRLIATTPEHRTRTRYRSDPESGSSCPRSGAPTQAPPRETGTQSCTTHVRTCHGGSFRARLDCIILGMMATSRCWSVGAIYIFSGLPLPRPVRLVMMTMMKRAMHAK